MFYDWLSTNTYEQTIRVDGFRQREMNIINPSYPDPGEPSAARRRRPTAICSPTVCRCSATSGSARARSRSSRKMLRVNATYAHTSGDNLMRGHNLNPPVDGVRPDPTFGNIVEVVGDA